MARFVQIIVGGAMIAVGVVAMVLTAGAAAPWAMILIKAGVGVLLSGVGTLLTSPHLGGMGTASRNPIAPWNIVYGRAKIGGTIVFIQEFGEDDKYLDLVIVLACHPCQSVDALLFDNQRVLINPATGSSYSPSQVTVSISSIVRSNGVVTVTMSTTIPDLEDGDLVIIKNVSGQVTNDKSLNGKYYIQLNSSTQFTYICGGFDVSLSGTGQVETTWPDYRSKVHMEVVLGNQTSTFPGMLSGTPYDGDPGDLVIPSDNPWTADHLLLERTAVFLRLHYNDEVFSAGLPNISFRVHGRTGIHDPRTDTVLERPTTLLNGWGNNAHEGAYEEGVDQAYNWGLNNDTTYGYSNPGAAVDGDLGSCAFGHYEHTHKYAGCIWQFAALGSTPSDLYLNILSMVPGGGAGTLRSAGIWYSLDGGSTWTEVYNTPVRPFNWDAIHLSTSQDASQVQVMAFLDAHDDMWHLVHDIHLGTGPATFGYSENPALCIADYLSNTTWGFKATYGTEIPTAPLIAAANVCDETVALAAGGTEPRYTCNGTFPLTIRRGEVLQNLLTSCAGRLTYIGGQFVIHPGAWTGPSFSIGEQVPVTATLTWVTSYTPGTGAAGTAAVTASVGMGFPPPLALANYLMYDGSGWTNRTDTSTWSSSSPGWSSALGSAPTSDPTTTVVSFFIFGSLFGSASPPAKFQVFDVYMDCTYADGSTARLRPTQVLAGTGDTTITNANNAIDGDPTTYAEIDRAGFSSLGTPAELQLGAWRVTSTGTPDLGAVAMAASASALAIAAGPFQWRQKASIRDLYNGVRGTYISPANGWFTSDFPPYAQDAKHGYSGPAASGGDSLLAQDGGDRRWLDIQLPFTISSPSAQRLAKIELMRRRNQGTGTFAFNLSLYQVVPLDVITMTLPYLGWRDKLLEIITHRLTINKQQNEGQEATLLGCELDMQETDPSIYDWSTSEELTPQGFQQATLPNPNNPKPPTSVTATSGSGTAVVGADGITRSRILVSWTTPADGYVTQGGHIEVQYQQVGTSTWIGLPSVDPSVTQVYINGVTDGQQYLVQVRSVNAAGVPSAWVQVGPVTVSGTPSAVVPTSLGPGGTQPGQTLVWNGTSWVPSTIGAVPNFADDETPSGAYDGVSMTLTLANTPNPGSSVELFRNGPKLLKGVDYTVSGATITMLLVAPTNASGDWYRAKYRYLGAASSGVTTTSGGVTGGTSGSSGTTGSPPAVANQIYADMTGLNEAAPEGVPPTWDFANGPFLQMGANPAGNNAILIWGGVYVPTSGAGGDTNTRLNVRNFQLYCLDNSGTWHNIAGSTGAASTNSIDGEYYAEDFSSGGSTTLNFRTESDSSISFSNVAHEVSHFFTPFPRVSLPSGFVGVVCVYEGRLIKDNPTGTDDTALARYIGNAGGDYYPATTGAGIANNPGVGGGKFKFFKTYWRSFSFTTLSLAQLTANPPPVSFTGVSA